MTPPPVDLAEFRHLHEQGWSAERLSAHLGISLRRHRRIRVQLGLPPQPTTRPVTGERLTKLIAARDYWLESGLTVAEIARRFDLGESAFRSWLHRHPAAKKVRSPSPREARAQAVGWPGAKNNTEATL